MEWPIFHTSEKFVVRAEGEDYGSRVWKYYSKRVVDYTFPNTILENTNTIGTL